MYQLTVSFIYSALEQSKVYLRSLEATDPMTPDPDDQREGKGSLLYDNWQDPIKARCERGLGGPRGPRRGAAQELAPNQLFYDAMRNAWGERQGWRHWFS